MYRDPFAVWQEILDNLTEANGMFAEWTVTLVIFVSPVGLSCMSSQDHHSTRLPQAHAQSPGSVPVSLPVLWERLRLKGYPHGTRHVAHGQMLLQLQTLWTRVQIQTSLEKSWKDVSQCRHGRTENTTYSIGTRTVISYWGTLSRSVMCI